MFTRENTDLLKNSGKLKYYLLLNYVSLKNVNK